MSDNKLSTRSRFSISCQFSYEGNMSIDDYRVTGYVFWLSEYASRKFLMTEEGIFDRQSILKIKENAIVNYFDMKKFYLVWSIKRTGDIYDDYEIINNDVKRIESNTDNNEYMHPSDNELINIVNNSNLLIMNILNKYCLYNDCNSKITQIDKIFDMVLRNKIEFLHSQHFDTFSLLSGNECVIAGIYKDIQNSGKITIDGFEIDTSKSFTDLMADYYALLMLIKSTMGQNGLSEETRDFAHLLPARILREMSARGARYEPKSDRARAIGLWLWDYKALHKCSRAC